MTQTELDALMAGDINLEEIAQKEEDINKKDDVKDGHQHKHYHDGELVSQLGEVTAESEQKGLEVFDNLDKVLAKLDTLEGDKENADEHINAIRDIVFETMSVMQYQDIHRQKIERVINTMRTISRVMNNTLDSVDNTFAPSAKHIAGDSDTTDLVDDDELEKLIAQMGNK